jgi:hypothetical protein
MEGKTRSFLGLSMSFLFLLWGCSGEKSAWMGSIAYENGIKVVRNPSQPAHGEFLLELEEDLSIGGGEDSNYRFYNARNLALDAEDNIYVLDTGNHRIQKFDRNGHYLQTIGKKGQGPGEFEGPVKICLGELNDLFVLDGQKIKVFDSRGNFLENVLLQNSLSDFLMCKGGGIIGLARVSGEQSKRMVVKIDSSGKIEKTIAEFPDVKPAERKDKGGGFRFTVYHVYSPRLCLSNIDGKTFCYAFALDYKLAVSDAEVNTLFKVRKEEAPKPISQKEKEGIIRGVEQHISRRGPKWPPDVLAEACHFSSRRPIFFGIDSDDKKRLWVWRVKSVLDKSEEEGFDLFSEEGHYLRLKEHI